MTDNNLARALDVSQVTIGMWRRRGMPTRSAAEARAWAMRHARGFRCREDRKLYGPFYRAESSLY
jgi:hypothetical protein